MLEQFNIVSFNIKNLSVKEIGLLHLDQDRTAKVLNELKEKLGLIELMYLSTCNRVELFFVSTSQNEKFVSEIVHAVNSVLSQDEYTKLISAAAVYNNTEAVRHVFRVASSLDSMVVGEREIITQVRKSFEDCKNMGFTGDFLRLLIKHTIITAKEIFTSTDIAKNPVSVVSLAYRKLRELNVSEKARFIIIGSGETNATMAKYLKKQNFANFAVFNRTPEKAEALASELGGRGFALSELIKHSDGFDIIVSCTAATEPILTEEVFDSLSSGELSQKIIIDLAVPTDTCEEVKLRKNVTYIGIHSLKEIAENNIKLREKELERCVLIIDSRQQEFVRIAEERRIELTFNEIPRQVRQIRDAAILEVFAKEINALDPNAKALLEKVVLYMEKKYNAVAMKTAKEILIEEKGILSLSANEKG